MKMGHSLKVRLTIVILLAILVFFSVNVTLSVLQSRRSLLEESYKLAQKTLSLNIAKIGAFLGEKMMLTWTLSESNELRRFSKNTTQRFYYQPPGPQASEEIQAAWESLAEPIKELSRSLPMAEPGGYRDPRLMEEYNHLVDTLRRITADDDSIILTYVGVETTQEFFCDPDIFLIPTHFYLRNRSWYVEGIATPDTIVSLPYIDNVTGKVVVTAVTPMMEGSRLLGTAAIDFTIDTVIDLVDTLQMTENSYAFLVDDSGSVISHRNKKFIMEANILESAEFPRSLKENFSRLKSGEVEYVEFRGMNSMGEMGTFLVFAEVIPETGWYTFLVVRKDDLLSAVRRLTATQIGLNTLFLLLMAVVSFFIIGRGLKGVGVVRDRMMEISQGEGDLTLQLNIHSKDELGELAAGFNRFVGSLRKIVGNVKKSTHKLSETNISLTDSTEESASSVTEITSNVNSVKDRIIRLDSSIGSTSQAMENIQSTIRNFFDDIENQASAVEQSGAAINEMVTSMENMVQVSSTRQERAEQLLNTTRNGGEKLAEMKGLVEEIHQSVDSIAEMVLLINTIAVQTNMLSMNAAIEAAHAGDAGRGFSIVAEEIRKLAETSGANAKRIRDELSNIIGKIEGAASSSIETGTAFESIQQEVSEVTQAMEELQLSTRELAQGGKQIREATEMLSEITVNVTARAKEMTENTEKINVSLHEVSQVSSEVKGAMDEISSGANQINESVNSVNNLAQGPLRDAAEELMKEIGSFYIGDDEEVKE